MSLAMRREGEGWLAPVLGTVAAGIAAAGALLAALLNRRTAQETKYYNDLAARVTDLEGKVERLLSELDAERQENLALIAERDGLKRELAAALMKTGEQASRILELEAERAEQRLERTRLQGIVDRLFSERAREHGD